MGASKERLVTIMHEIDKKKFGAFVAKLRKERGMTQKELAAMVYVSDKAVSKWETGVSIPDVSVLIPLAEALGVSVTELLECHRIERVEPQVELLVKKAVRYPETGQADEGKNRRAIVYLVCIGVAVMALFLLHRSGYGWSEGLQLSLLFDVLFGAYFMLLAKTRLPYYYDENRINGVLHGPFRMNIPGLAFNNHNWPHIVRVGRVWSMMFMVGYPVCYYLLYRFFPAYAAGAERYLMLAASLGGLFLPVYFVGKKYESGV